MNPDYGNLNKPSGQTPPPTQLPASGKALPGTNIGVVPLEDVPSFLFRKSSAPDPSFSPSPLSQGRVVRVETGEPLINFINQKSAKEVKINETIKMLAQVGGDSGDAVGFFKAITNDTKKTLELINQQQFKSLAPFWALFDRNSTIVISPSVDSKKTSDAETRNPPEHTDAPKTPEHPETPKTAKPSPKESDLKENAFENEVKSESSSKYEPEVESVDKRPMKPILPASDTSEDNVRVNPVEENINSKIENVEKAQAIRIYEKASDIIEEDGIEKLVTLFFYGHISVVSEDGTIYLDEKHSENEEIQKFIEEKNLTPVIMTEEDKEKMIEAFETIILPLLMASLNEYLAQQQASKEQPQAGGVAAEVEVTEDVTLSKMAPTSDDKETDKKGEKGKVDTVIIDPSAKIEAKKVERERQEKLKKEKYKKSIEKIRFYNTNERLREAAENADISNASLRAERVSKGGKI